MKTLKINNQEIKALAFAQSGNKFYICETQGQIERMERLGYTIKQIEELAQAYDREHDEYNFINSADLTKQYVKQYGFKPLIEVVEETLNQSIVEVEDDQLGQ